MRIYNLLPEFRRHRQLSLWHKALRAKWSPEDLDWDTPPRLSSDADRTCLARVLSPVLVGEFAGLYSITTIIQALGQTSEVEGQFFLTTMAADEAKHAEMFVQFYRRRLEREPISIRRFPSGYLFQTAVMSDEPMEWLAGSLVSEVLAKETLEDLRRLDLDPVLRVICDRILEDEARHLAFNHVFLADRLAETRNGGRIRAEQIVKGLRRRLDHVLGFVPPILTGLDADIRGLGLDPGDFLERVREQCKARLAKSIETGYGTPTGGRRSPRA